MFSRLLVKLRVPPITVFGNRCSSVPPITVLGDRCSLPEPPRELVDRLLDGEVDPSNLPDVLHRVRRDEQAAASLDSASRVLRELRRRDRDIRCPDLTDRILGVVAARKGLFSREGLRRLLAYRWAAAVVALSAVAAVYVVQRLAPDAVRLSPQPAPVSRVVKAVAPERAGVWSSVQGMFSTLGDAVPAGSPAAYCMRRLHDVNDQLAAVYASGINPPSAAVLWLDERPACGDHPSCPAARRFDTGLRGDRWACDFPAAGVLLESTRRRPADSDTVFVSFSR